MKLLRSNISKKRSASSKQWLLRQHKDQYVIAARNKGYRSRAAFKLEEINERENLLRAGQLIVDLGAAPGSWSQLAMAKTGGNSTIIALDILPMDPINGVEFLQGDFTLQSTLDELYLLVAKRPVDLVICDLAPNFSGNDTVDMLKAYELAESAFYFACDTLVANGSFLVKIFQGPGFMEYWSILKERFLTLKVIKPNSSRKESKEQYLLAKGFKKREVGLD